MPVSYTHLSFDLDEITLEDLKLRESGGQERVICLNRGEMLTEEKIIPFQRHPGKALGVDQMCIRDRSQWARWSTPWRMFTIFSGFLWRLRTADRSAI